MELELSNQDLKLRNVDRYTFKAIDERTSFPIPGAEWTKAYRMRYWDGRQHLVRFSKRLDAYRCPAGLLEDVLAGIKEGGITEFDFIDNRVDVRSRVEYDWRDTLRDYQEAAAQAAFKPRGPLKQAARCTLQMAIRSGKTRTGARVISELATKTLFIVNSQLLLNQGRAALAKALRTKIGQVGDGVFDLRPCTVATIQTLVRRQGGTRKVRGEDREEEIEMDPRVRDLIEEADLIMIDEAHHMEADRWRALMMACPARYRIGLTATLNEENDALLMRAVTGPVVYEVTPSQLIRQGYLMKPEIRLMPIRSPKISHYRRWSPNLTKLCITDNDDRNGQIVEAVSQLARKEKLRTLVTADKIDHVNTLCDKLGAAGLRVEKLTGSDPTSRREKVIERLLRRSIDVIVSTVLDEGVDIPELEAVVHAGGGASSIATMQRMRCLTPCKGKTKAVFVDFVDIMHPIYAEHAKARLDVYRSEPEFDVRILPARAA